MPPTLDSFLIAAPKPDWVANWPKQNRNARHGHVCFTPDSHSHSPSPQLSGRGCQEKHSFTTNFSPPRWGSSSTPPLWYRRYWRVRAMGRTKVAFSPLCFDDMSMSQMGQTQKSRWAPGMSD